MGLDNSSDGKRQRLPRAYGVTDTTLRKGAGEEASCKGLNADAGIFALRMARIFAWRSLFSGAC